MRVTTVAAPLAVLVLISAATAQERAGIAIERDLKGYLHRILTSATRFQAEAAQRHASERERQSPV